MNSWICDTQKKINKQKRILCLDNLNAFNIKTYTTESKIYTSPSQIMKKFSIYVDPIAKHLSLIFFNSCQVVFEIQGIEKSPPLGCMCARFLFHNSFDNALGETF
jgi:hypothetical protein